MKKENSYLNHSRWFNANWEDFIPCLFRNKEISDPIKNFPMQVIITNFGKVYDGRKDIESYFTGREITNVIIKHCREILCTAVFSCKHKTRINGKNIFCMSGFFEQCGRLPNTWNDHISFRYLDKHWFKEIFYLAENYYPDRSVSLTPTYSIRTECCIITKST